MIDRIERPRYEVAVISAKPMFLQIDQGDEGRWNRELVFALQIVRGNDLLQKCTPDSIMNAIVNIATIDVSLNPALALAYLVPRDGKCVLDISYRGLIKIGTDSGSIRSINANVVYSFDDFDYSEGTELYVKHKRSMNPPDDFTKDPLGTFWKYFVCAYSVATLHDGSKDYMLMPKYKIEKIRNTSKIKSERGPWGQWPEEMSRKTVIKYHYKTLPQSEKLGAAVAILNDNDGLELERNNNSKKLFEHIETLETKDGSSYDTPAGNDVLQAIYKKLTDYAGEKGETPDDLISRLTKGKVPALIELEGKPVNYLNDIALMVDTEREAK